MRVSETVGHIDSGSVVQKLEEWAKLAWREIDHAPSDSGHKMHHPMETKRICDEAQARLRDLERYDDEGEAGGGVKNQSDENLQKQSPPAGSGAGGGGQ